MGGVLYSTVTKKAFSVICRVWFCKEPLFPKDGFGRSNISLFPTQVASWKRLLVRRVRHLGPLFRDKPTLTKPGDLIARADSHRQHLSHKLGLPNRLMQGTQCWWPGSREMTVFLPSLSSREGLEARASRMVREGSR